MSLLLDESRDKHETRVTPEGIVSVGTWHVLNAREIFFVSPLALIVESLIKVKKLLSREAVFPKLAFVAESSYVQ